MKNLMILFYLNKKIDRLILSLCFNSASTLLHDRKQYRKTKTNSFCFV